MLLPLAQRIQLLLGLVRGRDLERLLVILDRQLPIAVRGVGISQAVIAVCGLWERLDPKLEYRDCRRGFLLSKKRVSHLVEIFLGKNHRSKPGLELADQSRRGVRV